MGGGFLFRVDGFEGLLLGKRRGGEKRGYRLMKVSFTGGRREGEGGAAEKMGPAIPGFARRA